VALVSPAARPAVAIHRPIQRIGSPTTRAPVREELVMFIEIRAAEGGNDSKLLVIEQLKVYQRFCDRRRL